MVVVHVHGEVQKLSCCWARSEKAFCFCFNRFYDSSKVFVIVDTFTLHAAVERTRALTAFQLNLEDSNSDSNVNHVGLTLRE